MRVPTFEPLGDNAFHSRMAALDGLAVVIFTAPGCGACRRALEQLPRLAAEASIEHLFLVDVEISTGLAREFEIFHLPALMLFRDGLFHAKIDAELTTASFGAAVAKALAAPAEEAP